MKTQWHLGQNGDNCARNHAIVEGWRVLAKVYGHGYPIGSGWAQSSEDTARLMSLAPDFLDACKGLIDYRDHNVLNFQLEKADDFINKMRDLIYMLEHRTDE